MDRDTLHRESERQQAHEERRQVARERFADHSMSTPKTDETPLVDAEASDGWSGDAECVSAQFAREKLERPLRAAKAKIAALEMQVADLENRIEDITARSIHSCSEKCQRPLCVANRRIRELELALEDAQADSRRLDKITILLEDVSIGDIDPTDHMTEMMDWPTAWRRAIDAAIAKHP